MCPVYIAPTSASATPDHHFDVSPNLLQHCRVAMPEGVPSNALSQLDPLRRKCNKGSTRLPEDYSERQKWRSAPVKIETSSLIVQRLGAAAIGRPWPRRWHWQPLERAAERWIHRHHP